MIADGGAHQAPVLRAAVDADIPRLMAIRGSVRENRLVNRRGVTAAAYRRRLPHIRVIETGGEVVGFGCGDPATGNIWALFLDEAHAGHGYGRRLLETVCADLAAAGCTEAWLTTDPDTRAEGFYRHLGWVQQGTVGLGELRFIRSLGQV